jgi:hypothetical protein
LGRIQDTTGQTQDSAASHLRQRGEQRGQRRSRAAAMASARCTAAIARARRAAGRRAQPAQLAARLPTRPGSPRARRTQVGGRRPRARRTDMAAGLADERHNARCVPHSSLAAWPRIRPHLLVMWRSPRWSPWQSSRMEWQTAAMLRSSAGGGVSCRCRSSRASATLLAASLQEPPTGGGSPLPRHVRRHELAAAIEPPDGTRVRATARDGTRGHAPPGRR